MANSLLITASRTSFDAKRGRFYQFVAGKGQLHGKGIKLHQLTFEFRRRWFTSVVFPAPKNPVMIVQGTRVRPTNAINEIYARDGG